MVLDDEFSNDLDDRDEAIHSKFGKHKLSCYVDVSTEPTTFITRPLSETRNLEMIDIETSDATSNWKDFREATYVFEYNSPVINYLDLTNSYTSGYF